MRHTILELALKLILWALDNTLDHFALLPKSIIKYSIFEIVVSSSALCFSFLEVAFVASILIEQDASGFGEYLVVFVVDFSLEIGVFCEDGS